VIFSPREVYKLLQYFKRKKKISANLFEELLAMFGYPLFFIMNFCYEKKIFSF